MIGGGSAFWVLAYGLFYWATQLTLHTLSSIALYLGYLFLLALLDFLVTGECLYAIDIHVHEDTQMTSQVPSDSSLRTGLCENYIQLFESIRRIFTSIFIIIL